jgi:hypothetical protein
MELRTFLRRIKVKATGYLGPLPRPKKWIFVVGCYNSGTSLLHNILASCPGVGSMPQEGHVFTDQLLMPKSVGLYRLWALKPELFYLYEDNTKISVTKLKRQWGSRYDNPNSPILIEKSPPNVARLRWLQQNFENAFFVGIIRNGYAVAEGIRRKSGHSIDLASKQWVISNEIMLRDFKFLARGLLIKYEDLTEHPDQTLEKLSRFLELNVSSFAVSDKIWNVHEYQSKIKNMNEVSFNRLTAEDIETVTQVAGEMLVRLEYKRLSPAISR